MLVLFRFKNYGPFREEACIDMRAVKTYKEHPDNLIDPDAANSYVKVASIYGANASGKSNFVDAYRTFSTIVRRSFTGNGKTHDAETETLLSAYSYPFYFNLETFNTGTEFEGVYVENGVEYRYGFSFNRQSIEYEWLYKKPLNTGRTSMILERSPEDGLILGSSIRRTLEKYKADIDEDVLALSFFSSLKLKTAVFSDTVKSITAILPWKRTIYSSREDIINVSLVDMDGEAKEHLMAFLNAIDIGIKDIRAERNINTKKVEIYTSHLDEDNSLVEVPLAIESDGTINAIALYSMIRFAIDNNKGLIIDEINLQLHPLLFKYLVDLFTKDSKDAQLIYTTHDTTLLDKRYMRRDQVWFIEKNQKGESSLFSLAEFRVRNDSSFEKDYLGGVYGAIPILSDFSFGEANDEEK